MQKATAVRVALADFSSFLPCVNTLARWKPNRILSVLEQRQAVENHLTLVIAAIAHGKSLQPNVVFDQRPVGRREALVFRQCQRKCSGSER